MLADIIRIYLIDVLPVYKYLDSS